LSPLDLGIPQITRKDPAEVMPGDRLGEFALLDVPATFGALAFDIPDRSNAGGVPTGDKPPICSPEVGRICFGNVFAMYLLPAISIM
jgi:hypothetical protein